MQIQLQPRCAACMLLGVCLRDVSCMRTEAVMNTAGPSSAGDISLAGVGAAVSAGIQCCLHCIVD